MTLLPPGAMLGAQENPHVENKATEEDIKKDLATSHGGGALARSHAHAAQEEEAAEEAQKGTPFSTKHHEF